MTENENVSTDQGSVEESKIEAKNGSLSRRGFLQKSVLLSAPVIMTIASGPVWARPRNCTLSGRLSGNLSDTGPECPPAACSPGYWRQDQHLGSWSTTPGYRPNSNFDAAFGVAAFAGATLLQVVREDATPVDPPSSCGNGNKDNLKKALKQLGFHAVAALQNSLTLGGALDYPHSTATVIQKFRDGFAAYNACDKDGIIAAKDYLEYPYLNIHFCPFGNDGSNSDQNKNG